MASNAEDVRQAAIKELARRELLRRQGASTEPFELPELSNVQAAQARITRTLGPTQFSPEERALAQQGLDITTGSPVGRFAAGFAQNPALQVEDLKGRLAEHFGQPVEASTGSAGLEFIDPETSRRVLVDEVTLSGGDIAELVGPSITAAGAIGGGIAGLPFGVPNIGAGLGGALGEAGRRAIGQQMGVREETPEQIARGAVGVGAIEAAAGKGAELGIRGIQRGRSFLQRQPLTPGQAENVLGQIEPDMQIAEEISRRTGQRFQPFTGQMSGDATLLGGQSTALNVPATATRMRQQLFENETALESMFFDLHPPATAPSTAVGRAVQVEARGQVQPRVEAARESAEEATENLQRLSDEIPAAESSAIVQSLTQQAATSRQIVKEAEDEAWTAVRQLYGHNPQTALSDVKVPVGGKLQNTLRELQAEAQQAIDPAITSGKEALVPGGLTEDAVDLHQLQVHLSSLRRRQRIQRQGKVATDPQGRDLSRVENDLVAQRNAHLKETNPELLAQIMDAERQTAQRADLFDNSLVGQLLRKERGEWQLRDSELIGRTIGSGDRQAIQHLVSALDNHPAGVPTLQRSFLQFYRNTVVRDGVPNRGLHDEFLRNHSEAIDELFPGDTRIRQLGEFERVAQAKVDRFGRFEKAVERSFRGRIQNIAPERVAEDIFNKGFSVKDASRLMSLAEAAGVKQQYQNAITGRLNRRFTSVTGGMKLNVMDKFISDNEEKLVATLGGRYVRDMKLLLGGLKTIRTEASGIATTRNPTLIGSLVEGIARTTVARPLSPGGVGLTRVLGFRERAAQHLLSEAIMDPKALRAIVAQRNSDLRSRAVTRILSVLGATDLAIEKFEEVEEE